MVIGDWCYHDVVSVCTDSCIKVITSDSLPGSCHAALELGMNRKHSSDCCD